MLTTHIFWPHHDPLTFFPHYQPPPASTSFPMNYVVRPCNHFAVLVSALILPISCPYTVLPVKSQACISVTMCLLSSPSCCWALWKWPNSMDQCHSKFIGPYCQGTYFTFYSAQANFLIATPLLLADKLIEFAKRKLRPLDKHLKTLLTNHKLKHVHLKPTLPPGTLCQTNRHLSVQGKLLHLFSQLILP